MNIARKSSVILCSYTCEPWYKLSILVAWQLLAGDSIGLHQPPLHLPTNGSDDGKCQRQLRSPHFIGATYWCAHRHITRKQVVLPRWYSAVRSERPRMLSERTGIISGPSARSTCHTARSPTSPRSSPAADGTQLPVLFRN